MCTRTLLLDEFYASGDSKEVSLSEWVVRESLPVVDHLTPRNFALYEKLGVPMLLLFLVRALVMTCQTIHRFNSLIIAK